MLFILSIPHLFCYIINLLGFFLNYYRLLNLASDYDLQCIHMILICSSFATTIAIFLHTLRFKGYIDPKVSLAAYVISYLSTFIGYGLILHVFVEFPYLTVLCLIGLVINLYSFVAFDVYQVTLCLLYMNRATLLPLLLSEK